MKSVLFLFLCIALNGYAQESVNEIKRMAFGNPMDVSNQNLINMLNHSEDQQSINVLRYNSWQPMKAIGLDSTILYVDSANYHVLSDKIIFMNEGKLFELHPDKVLFVELASHEFLRAPFKSDENRNKTSYFEILEAGDYALLAKYELKKKVVNSHPMGFPGTSEVEYYQEESYYYLRQGARLPEEVPSKRKDFVLIFRKNRPQIVDYAKEHRTSLHSAEDLKAIFQYYNTLASQS